MSQLNPEQQKAHDGIVEYIYNGTVGGELKNFVILEGFAGSGKTYTLSAIADTIAQNNEHKNLSDYEQEHGPSKRRPVLTSGLTAPTHKAVKVIQKTIKNASRFDFGTIHSFLGLKPVIQKDGSQKFIPDPMSKNKGLKMDKIDVLWVDESSMLNMNLFVQKLNYIRDKRKGKHPLRIIYVGDPLQIPPVGETNSIIFSPEVFNKYKVHKFSLKTIMRQASENPILAFATDIRESIQADPHVYDFTGADLGTTGVQVISTEEAEALYKELFTSEEFEKDSDYAKVLCWKNSVVNSINKKIRSIRLGSELNPDIVVGDKLVADAPIMINQGGLEVMAFHNSDEFEVIDVSVITEEYHYKITSGDYFNPKDEKKHTTFKLYKAVVKGFRIDGTPKTHTIRIVHEDSKLVFNNLLQTLKKSALEFKKGSIWREFYALMNHYARVKYNYAVTCHKAQGSTYDYTIMVQSDINKYWEVEDRNRIRYVAATRARQKLYVL